MDDLAEVTSAAQKAADTSDASLKAADANVTATAIAASSAVKTQFETKLQNIAVHGVLESVKIAGDVEKLTSPKAALTGASASGDGTISAATPTSGASLREKIIVWGGIAVVVLGIAAYFVFRH